jgi:hypothetical protein
MKALGHLTLLVFLSSCASTATSDEQAPDTTPKETAQEVEEQPPTQTSDQPGDSNSALGENDELTLRKGNADRVNAETDVTAAGLAKALPGRQIKDNKRSVEGEEYSVFEVYDGKELLFFVEPYDGSLRTLTVKSPRLKTAEGVGVGSTFLELEASLGELECGEGDEDYSVYALCTSSKYENMTFAFPLPRAPIRKVSKAKVRRALRKKNVVFVWWQGPEE